MATTPTPTAQSEPREQHDRRDHQEAMFEDSTGFADDYAEEASFEAGGDSDDLPEVITEESEEPGSHPASGVASDPVADLQSESSPMTVFSVDDFAALEERVLKAVSLVRRERQGRAAAEERAIALESQLHQFEAQLQSQAPAIAKLQQEIDSLRVEREQVRHRVDRLLSQLDALEL